MNTFKNLKKLSILYYRNNDIIYDKLIRYQDLVFFILKPRAKAQIYCAASRVSINYLYENVKY